MQRVIDAFEQNLDHLITTAVARVHAAKHPFYSALPAAILGKAVGGAFQAVLADLKAGTTTQFASFCPGAPAAGHSRCLASKPISLLAE